MRALPTLRRRGRRCRRSVRHRAGPPRTPRGRRRRCRNGGQAAPARQPLRRRPEWRFPAARRAAGPRRGRRRRGSTASRAERTPRRTRIKWKRLGSDSRRLGAGASVEKQKSILRNKEAELSSQWPCVGWLPMTDRLTRSPSPSRSPPGTSAWRAEQQRRAADGAPLRRGLSAS
jgi:hypothetical protein